MEKAKRNSPFIPFKHESPGLKDFDKTYKTIKIIDKAVKTGEGEDDFIIKKKVIVEERPIQEVIDVDKDSVGVDNIIKQVLRTGDTSLLPVDKGDGNVDLVGAPEDLMQLKQMGIDAQNAFDNLPKDLTKGMDMKAFVASLTQEQFDAFVKAMVERSTPKKEEVTE